tara:strand:+ start:207 stop:893 length:687 start_codon:yes stop_codon:yes gene_type:complete
MDPILKKIREETRKQAIVEGLIRRRKRKIIVYTTSDVTNYEKDISIGALKDLLRVSKAENKMSIVDESYRNIDSQVDSFLNWGRGQICLDDEEEFFKSFKSKEQPHYGLLVTNRDLYRQGVNFLIGIGGYERSEAVISINRFRGEQLGTELIKQEVYHEAGHMFGLPNELRGTNLEYSVGTHCTNNCAMGQGLIVPDDWIDAVKERLRTNEIYCKQDLETIKEYFSEK